MTKTLLTLLLTLFPVSAQTPQLPHAFPRDGVKQLIENERVTVWEATWQKGKPTPMHRHQFDVVGVELADATGKGTNLHGVATNIVSRLGKVGFTRKGATHM